MPTQTTSEKQSSVAGRALHLAFELSESKWVLALSDAQVPAAKARLVTMPSRDLERLRSEITKARKRFALPADCPVRSCYEAGRDGLWLHRYLVSIGVDNHVVDSASIEVSRRKRRAKTDRLDARKLLKKLLEYGGGETRVWSVVRVPRLEDEDARQLHRELEQLKKEAQQHRLRIQSLLVTQGLKLSMGRAFVQELAQSQLWDGQPVPPMLQTRLRREYERLSSAQVQLREVERERKQLVQQGNSQRLDQVRMLQSLRGIGMNGSWLLVMELFGWRQFANGKQVGAAAGLTGTPYDSGGCNHEQGISKAGNRRVRRMMVELAWCWLRYQPDSALSRWFQQRWGPGSKRQRKVGLVALARRLLIALWRFVECGLVPDGALLKTA